MGTPAVIKLGVLTSSRADFGIYTPLLLQLKKENIFSFDLIVFGTHVSHFHGYSVKEINELGFEAKYKIESLVTSETCSGISTSFGLTALKFADFWNNHGADFDYVIALGDRFEMAAAALATIPFGIKLVHLYGGESTIGAIDDVYRNCLTVSSKLHFVSIDEFKNRVEQITGKNNSCFAIGSLSLDSIKSLKLLSYEDFLNRWGIDLRLPYILVTVHPETVAFHKNKDFADQVFGALTILSRTKQVIITMPNADTEGIIFRSKFLQLKKEFPDRFQIVESFGKLSYFTCMKYADHLIGNTSSGIVEAASFNKFVINIGDRQKGRPTSGNVRNVPFDSDAIVKASQDISSSSFEGGNMYHKENAASRLIECLSKYHVSSR